MKDKTVGKFTYCADTEMVEGPAEFMREKGRKVMADIAAGRDVVFNMTATKSPDAVTAVLVRLQTVYAGWRGTKELVDRFR